MNLELLGEEGCGCVLANPLVLERREPGREGNAGCSLRDALLRDDSLNAHDGKLQQQEKDQLLSEENALPFRVHFQISCGVIGALLD